MDKRFIAAMVAGFMGFGTAMAADVGAQTTVGGLVFSDFGYVNAQSDGKEVSPTGTGFDIKRGYLSIEHGFNDIFSADLTTDVQYISSTSGTGYSSSTTASSGGVTELFVKLLYLQAKLNDAFVFRAGSYNSPWTSYAQSLYGYRYVEKTETDRLGFASTADWGLNATGVAGGNGWFSYAASVVDGGGYKNPTRTKDVDFEGTVGVKPLNWLNVGAGFYSGHLGQITQTAADYASNTATRWDLAVGVVTPLFRVGGEYFNARNYKTASTSTGVLSGPGGVVVATNATTADPTGTVRSDKADGFSSWASYNFIRRWSVFARYDWARPSRDNDRQLKDQYLNIGVEFAPIKALDLALVYKHEHVTDGSMSFAGGDGNASYTIGGTGAAGTGARTSGQWNEIGVYTQYKF